MLYTVKYRHYFDSAHQLTDSGDLVTKKCINLHGHTYAVEVELYTGELNKGGMIVDFSKVKEIIDVLDHKFINDVFKENKFYEQATAENIAKFLFGRFTGYGYNVRSIAIKEGYKGEHRGAWCYVEES